MALYYSRLLNKLKFYWIENKRWYYIGHMCVCVCVGRYTFICIRQKYNWRSSYLSNSILTENHLLEGFSVGVELLLFIYLKCALPFSPAPNQSSCAVSECVETLHLWSHGSFLPAPWFSSSQWVPVKPEKKCFPPAPASWSPFPSPSPPAFSSGPHWVSEPLRNLLWCHSSVIFLLAALWSYTEFQTKEKCRRAREHPGFPKYTFFMSTSLLKYVDRGCILSSHYRSVLMSNWQMSVSKTRQYRQKMSLLLESRKRFLDSCQSQRHLSAIVKEDMHSSVGNT